MAGARLVRCKRCRRMFIAGGNERLCPECTREGAEVGPPRRGGFGAQRGTGGVRQISSSGARRTRDDGNPWPRRPPWRGGAWYAWRALIWACGACILAGMVIGALDPVWTRDGAWAGFVAGMYWADKH